MPLDTQNWMSDAAIQAKQIGNLVLPGTHDSGTYNLSKQLSTVSYSNISFLWNLDPGTAPVNGIAPWANKNSNGDPIYFTGQVTYDFIMDCVKQVSQSQDPSDTIKSQLDNGIRLFDLRVYYDTTTSSPDFYLQHALRGPLLRDILNDVRSFVGESRNELIFLQVSHTNFKDDLDGHDAISGIIEMLQQTLGDALFTPVGPTLSDAIFTTTLSDITGLGTRVIVLNGDDYVTYPSVLFNGSFSSTDDPGGVDTVGELESRELAELVKHQSQPNTFYGISWALTAQSDDIINSIIQFLTEGISPGNILLETFARQANSALYFFIKANFPANKFNFITCDWYRQLNNPGHGKSVVDIAMELSKGNFN